MIELPWAEFKTQCIGAGWQFVYFEVNSTYMIYATNTYFNVLCQIYKDGSDDQVDFETNYMALAAIKNRVTSSAAEEWVNSGLSFSHCHTHTLGNGAISYHLLRTPAAPIVVRYVHEVKMTSSGRVEIYEAPTITNIGNSVNVYNRDRNSTNVPALILTHGPTVTAEGTLLEAFEGGGGGGAGKSASQFGNVQTVLKQNTDYLLKYVSSSVGNVYSEFQFWSEVEEL